MFNSIWATIHDGQIEPAERIDLPEGATGLVTLLPDQESNSGTGVSDKSIAPVWDNTEDDVYAQLLDQ